jgi:flagellin
LEFTISGETFRGRDDIGSELAANGIYRFTSLSNPNNVLEFRVGDTAIEFDTAEKALNFENALKNAFGIGAEGSGQSLKFQVGVTTTDTLSVRLDSVTTDTIFGGAELDVLTADNAAIAADAIDAAIDMVTSVRADVGAMQSRFDFAAANIESSIQNQDAARGVLLDTDIAAESSAFATAQVQLQAGISVLAQANLLSQNLLKLIEQEL